LRLAICGFTFKMQIDTKVSACHGQKWRILCVRNCRRFEDLLMVSRPLVSVVDDDESVRESLPELLAQLGFSAMAFASAAEFLASDSGLLARCLILDISMPGMSGPQLQRHLLGLGVTIPIIFISAQCDEGTRAAVMEDGAIDCLFKPFSDQALRMALQAALCST
jgi:FixJ family two-component response regulator